MPAMQLDGRRVLLTGASGGIGNAIARALHVAGATVVLNGRRADALDGLAAALENRVETLVGDLGSREDPGALLERAGNIDVLVANAALPASGWLVSFTPEETGLAL